MNPEEPAEPSEAAKPPESAAIPPSRSVRSVYIAPSATQAPAGRPSVAKPRASVAKPSISRPSVSKPPSAKPSVSKPPGAKPSVSKPPGAKPSVSKPSAAKPPAAKRPKPFAPKGPKKAAAPSDRLQPPRAEPPDKGAEPPDLSKTAPQEEPAAPLSKKAKAAIQKRAEGRTKVPGTFRDSLKYFCFSPTGLLKILRMIIIVASVICFVVGQAHETFIVITIQEASIVLFFIIVYMVTLQHLLVYLHWPLFDLINSFISAVFLLIVAALTWQEKERRQLFYIGGVLCLTAAIVCFIDALVVTKKMRTNIKGILGIKAVPPREQEQDQEQPKPQPN